MSDGEGTKAGWREYRPSKKVWLWSCVGSVVATIVVGFGWGGWVTGGTAAYRVDQTREAARAELAATICVERFISAPDGLTQLAALKEESVWSRDDTIADGGWATPVGFEEPIDNAAELCAERLAAMELPQEAAAGVTVPGLDAEAN